MLPGNKTGEKSALDRKHRHASSSGPKLVVQSTNPLEDPDWDARLLPFPQASFFHTSAWAKVLYSTYGYAPDYLRINGGDHPAMALPLMEVNSPLTGRRGISLPFTDECAVLGTSPDMFAAIFRHLLMLGERRSWKYYELRGTCPMESTGPVSVSYYGHRLDLQAGPTALLGGCDSAVRRGIRKAEQAAVTVEFARDLPAVRTFYDLLCQTRQRHGLPPQPYSFFENIQRHVMQDGKGDVVLARVGGRAIAGAVFFRFGREVIYKFGASDETHQQLRGNNLVFWKAIEHYATHGFALMDFGRTSLANAGLRRFKLSWGCQERAIDYKRYEFKQRAFVTSSDQASGGWHSFVFRRLPLGLSRLIGAAAYKHLA